jgi:hypothetical protein
MIETNMDAVQRLTSDLREGVKAMTRDEARFLVDAYYTIQDYRIAAANQVKSVGEAGEPCDVLRWLFSQHETMEGQIKRALNWWTDAHPVSVWAKSVVGIGPVISAGLMAHIDITKAPTVGHIWSFAGLDPRATWGKGEKRPYNAKLKVLCWKIGQSFVKVSNNKRDFYGKLYQKRKAIEIERNEAGLLADQAEEKLAKFKIGKDTDAYKAYIVGKLPPAHIQARAERWAVKVFLSHYHAKLYQNHFGVAPPEPYPIAILGHAHNIEIPDFSRTTEEDTIQ